MKKHKLWSSALALTLVASLFAGCGGGKQAETPQAEPETTVNADGTKEFANKELNIAVFEGGFGKVYWEEVIKRFEADYPGVKVNLTSNPKIMDVIKPKIVSGNPPDMIYAPMSDQTGTISSMIKEKALEPLNDIFDENALDQDVPLKDMMTEGILDYAMPHDDGNIYYAPFYMSSLGLWYNKNLFEEKGWEPPATWDEFFALGDVAKEEGRSLFTYQGIYPTYLESVLWPAIASAGGEEAMNNVLSYEKDAVKSDAIRQAFTVFYDIAHKDYLMPGTVALNHTQAQTEFLKGKALFVPNGNWFEGEMKDAPREEGFEFGFLPIPTFESSQQRYVAVAYEGLFVPAKAKNKELAKEFIRYQYKEDNVKLNAEKTTGVLAIKNGAEIAKDYIPESVYESMKVFDNGVKPLFFQWKVTPKTEVMINEEMFNPISNIMNKEMTVDEWIDRVDTASTKLREIIEKSK
ncbi:carbohydrate ABC transporter substrate-binding protein [Paenibacillus faecalis]|uniref:carbohydrate ABC transporter substrate-binding protein n=1 Tax=Paenibacillus faecalis TaxID=2079532 RepID=UPI000D0FD8A3|nr:carbohydrate ABC transporter substrate-binding protein [Paenibacillus faecalis]